MTNGVVQANTNDIYKTSVSNSTSGNGTCSCNHTSSGSPSIFMENDMGVKMVNPTYASYSTDSWINNNNNYWTRQQDMEYQIYQQQRSDKCAKTGGLAGVAAGAAIGSVVGFPIGTVVGGIVGGIAGLVGGKLFANM